MRTQGDNNREPDPFVLGKKDIRGKVVLKVRGGRARQVWSGAAGRWLHLLQQSWLAMFFHAGIYGKPAWHALTRLRPLRWLRWVLPDLLVVGFVHPHGEERRALMGRLHVATLPVGDTQWLINRWGKLILNPQDLFRNGQTD